MKKLPLRHLDPLFIFTLMPDKSSIQFYLTMNFASCFIYYEENTRTHAQLHDQVFLDSWK